MPDQQSYELYMFGVEAMCRDVVAHAMELAMVKSTGDGAQKLSAPSKHNCFPWAKGAR